MSALGSLVVKLALEYAEYTKGLDKGEQDALRFAKNVQGEFDKLGAGLKKAFAAIGTGFAINQLSGIVTASANAADEMSKLSQRSGVAVESLSRLNYAASLNDASLGDLERGLKGLSNKMLDAAKGGAESGAAFAALGVSVKDSNGHLRAVDAVFADVADAFAGLEDGAGKAAIANKLMEESGLALIPTLNNGAAGLKAMAEESDRFGFTITKSAAAAAVQFNDDLRRLDVMGQAFGRTIGTAIIPTVSQISREMIGWAQGMNDASGAGDELGQVVANLYNIAVGAATAFKLLGQSFNGVFAAASAIVSGDFRLVGGIIDAMLEDMDRTAQAAASSMSRVSQAANDVKKSSESAKKPLNQLNLDLLNTAKAGKSAAESQKTAAAAYKAFADAIKAATDNAEAAAEADAKIIELARDGLSTLHDQIAAQVQHNEEIGLGTAALTALRVQRLLDASAINDQLAAQASKRFADVAEIEAYEQKSAALRKLAELQKEGAVKLAAVESAAAARDAWRDISDDIAKSLTDAILAGGSNGWELLKRQIEATVLRATVVPVVQGAVNSVIGSVGLGPGGGTAGSSLFSGLSSAGAIGSALGAFGTGLGAASASVGAVGLGGSLSAAGSLIGTGSSAGVGAGLGMGAGAIAPYALAAYLALDAMGVFKGATPHRGGAAFSEIGGASGLANAGNTSGFGLDWGAYRSDRSAALDQSVSALIDGIAHSAANRAARYGGDASGVRITGRFASDNSDYSVGGLQVGSFAFDKRYTKDGAKAFAEFGAEAVRAEVAALQSADLSSAFERVFAAVDPLTSSLDVLNQALSAADAIAEQTADAERIRAVDQLDASEAARRAGLSASAAWFESSERIREAAHSGALSIAELGHLAESHYANQVQLLRSIESASSSMSEMFGNSARDIRFSVLDAAGKYDFLDKEAARFMDTLRGLTDVSEIEAYGRKLNDTINSAFRLLDSSEQARTAPQFEDRMQRAEALVQERLDAQREAVKADQKDTMKALADSAAESLRRAGDELVAGLQKAAAAIPGTIGVNVNVSIPPPASAEVGYIMGDN